MQWFEDVDPSTPVKVPLGHVYTLGADGGYGDGCSVLGGVSSRKTPGSKRKRTVPQVTEEFTWSLEDVKKIVVVETSGVYVDSSVAERTMLTFTHHIQTGGKWARQSS